MKQLPSSSLSHANTPVAMRSSSSEQSSANDVIDFNQLFDAARRHWRRIAIGVVFVMGLALAYLRFTVPQYEAMSTVRIDSRSNTLPTIYAEQPTRDEVFTEIEVLRSRTIAADVVDAQALQVEVTAPRHIPRGQIFRALQMSSSNDTGTFRLRRSGDGVFTVDNTSVTVRLGTTATLHGVTFALDSSNAGRDLIEVHVRSRDDAIEKLRKAVDIGRAGLQASIIALRYESPDPVIARDVLNAWTASFIKRRQNIQRTEATSAASFIQAQLDTLTPQLANAEGKLLAYRNLHQIVAPEYEASTQVSQSALLQASRNALDAERAALQEAMNRVRALATTSAPEAPSPYRDLLGFPTLLRNQAASELLRSLSALDDQRTALLMRRTAVDPDVITVSERIHVVEGQLQALTNTYLRGLTSQVAQADVSLANYSSKLRAIPTQEVEYARLQRAPKVYQELASLLQTRLKEAQITQAVTDVSVRVVDNAVAPTRPSTPNPPLVLAFGAVGGLLFGAALAFVSEQRVSAVRSRRELQSLSDMPVLGLIPTFSTRHRPITFVPPVTPAVNALPKAKRLAVASTTTHASELAADEAFTRLLLNIQWAAEQPLSSLLITSPLPGDGKTTSALHLAVAAAHEQRRVLLIDADLRRGGLTEALALRDHRGLIDVLSGACTLRECIATVELPRGRRVDVLGTGSLSRETAVSSVVKTVGELLNNTGEYDLIIVDSSPINIVADAAALAPLMDAVLLVARSGETSPAAIELALEQLHRAGGRVLGTVLNGAEFRRNDGYGSIDQYRVYADART